MIGGFTKTPIKPQKPGTLFPEADTEAEDGRKKYYKAEAEAETIMNRI